MSKILLHVGFPKAGSSFLGDWFHQNPNFNFDDFTIAGFNNTQDIMNEAINATFETNKVYVIRDMRFSAPDSNDFKNLDNIETVQQKVAKTLYSLFPHAKILIITRGFESALIANYSQYLKEGGILKLEEYLNKHKNSKWLPINYHYLIKLYSDLFGADNVLVIPFEMLKANSTDFLRLIENYMGIPKFEYNPKIKNKSLSFENMTAVRKMNKIIYIVLFIFGPLQFIFYKLYKKLLDKQKTKSWNNSIFKMFSKLFKTTEIKLILPVEIKNKFSQSGENLKEYKIYNDYKKEYYIN